MQRQTWMRGILAAGVLLWVGFAAAEQVRYDQHRLVRVTIENEAELERMLAISGDFWSESVGIGVLPFRVPPDKLDELQASGLDYEVVHENVQQLIDRERGQLLVENDDWFATFHTNQEISDYADTLIALRPDLASRETIGFSVQNQPIYAIRITSANGGADKPEILFNGTQHAREWASPATCMYIADQLIRQYDSNADVRELLDYAVFYIVPVVNPDGYAYTFASDRLWRKNRRDNGNGTFGVDLNRNWDINFGGSGSDSFSGSDIYHGPAPFSEPETAAVRDFVLNHPNLIAHIDFHSYSQLILYPWGYTSSTPPDPDGAQLAFLAAEMADAIFATHGEVYDDQPAHDLYLASGIASDWSYAAAGTMSFTIELRPDSFDPGFILPPGEIIPMGEENFAAIQALARELTLPVAIEIDGGAPPTLLASDTATPIAIAVKAVNDTPAQVELFARVNGGRYNEIPLQMSGGDSYTGELPAAGCGDVVGYYVAVETTGGLQLTKPVDGMANPFLADVADIEVYIDDPMETDTGWTVGSPADTASTGIWNRMNPEGTAAQPEDDHTAIGTDCWVTDGRAGTSLGTWDVDGGQTTLTSPALNLAEAIDPKISYWRWFSNSEGAAANSDVLRVEINDGSGWTALETVGPDGLETNGGWFRAEYRVADFINLTSDVRVRFIAADEGSGSIVEAAIDDLRVVDIGCFGSDCVGDLSGNGVTDFEDFSILVNQWGGPGGDLTGDGTTDFDDFSVLVNDWGCGQP